MTDLPDDAIEAAAKAMLLEQTNGLCEYPNICEDCDCFGAGPGYARKQAVTALKAAYPLVAAAVRADWQNRIADAIEAKWSGPCDPDGCVCPTCRAYVHGIRIARSFAATERPDSDSR